MTKYLTWLIFFNYYNSPQVDPVITFTLQASKLEGMKAKRPVQTYVASKTVWSKSHTPHQETVAHPEGSCPQERHNGLRTQLFTSVIAVQSHLIVVDKVPPFIHEKVMCWLWFWDIKKLQTLLEQQQQILKKHLLRSYYEPNSKMKDKNAIKTR